jgi:site-specific DNA-methyltransferase (adenine-specific)
MNNITLYQGDSLKLLKSIEDNSIDLVVMDPPFIFNAAGGGGAFGHKNRKNMEEMYKSKSEHLKFGFDFKILDELKRVMKLTNIYIFCNKNLLVDLLVYYRNYNFDILVYHKTNPTPTVNNKYLSDLEYILFVREKGAKLYGNYHSKSKLFSQPQKKREWLHPTIKPLNIIETLINNSSLEGDTILDPFIGSGTTAVACIKNNRHCIGMEIDPEYYELANTRVKDIQDRLETELF